MQLLYQPWPWYVSGVVIGLIVPAALILGNKAFGVSSSLRHICAICFPANIDYFKYAWRKEIWNLFFVGGIIAGSVITSIFFTSDLPIELNTDTKAILVQNNINDFSSIAPTEIFSLSGLLTVRGFICIVIGGFLVGFGTRYAGGCTSGHSISGLSNLQVPSLIATICFMVGGIITTWFILPLILKL